MAHLGGGRLGQSEPTAVERAFQEHHALVVGRLAAHFGDRQLAEDAVQDAFEAATMTWERDGVPDRPEAWLVVTARRKAIDRLRRRTSEDDRHRVLAESARDTDSSLWVGAEAAAIADDHLRLIFTCCHPALSIETRVALTLRVVCGLTTADIAHALLTTEATMAQRISRAKKKIRDANITYRAPRDTDVVPRLSSVLATIYLIFNKGYTRRDLVLCAEAIRLGRLVSNLVPDDSEAHGLVALMCLHAARAEAREHEGRLLPPDEQDRTLWDRELIEAGLAALRRTSLSRPGPYQVQALIAAAHSDVSGRGSTDWSLVAGLYSLLAEIQPSPVVEVNRAFALGKAGEPARALDLLEPYLSDPQLETYQPLYLAHAELLRMTGSPSAREAYDRALTHTSDRLEREAVIHRIQALEDE